MCEFPHLKPFKDKRKVGVLPKLLTPNEQNKSTVRMKFSQQ